MAPKLRSKDKKSLSYLFCATMHLTRAADYAVRVMIHLATLPPGTRVNRDSLAAASEVCTHFLSKVLQVFGPG